MSIYDVNVAQLGKAIAWKENNLEASLAFVSLMFRECVRNLDLRVQVHPGELWFSKQWVRIVLEASKSAGAKGDVPKIFGFMHPLHPC